MYEEYLKHVNLDVTEKIENLVKNDVFGDSEYLFIKKVDGISNGYCSKCNNEFNIKDIKHNEHGRCPICGAWVKAKQLRYGRQICKNEACFYYFEKSISDSKVVVCKGYYITKDYVADYKNPETIYNLCAVYIFQDKRATMLKRNYWDDAWDKKSSIFDFNQGFLATKMCYCSFKCIGKAIKNTRFQYIPYRQFQQYHSMVKLFSEFSMHPCIEYLVKEGFGNLVEGKLRGVSTQRTINWNGKTIFNILKISKLDLREIKSRKIDVTFNFLKVFQDIKKQGWEISLEEVIKISTTYSASYYEELKKITEYNSIRKILKYILIQLTKFNGVGKDKHYCREDSVLIKLKDYIADCNLLGMDVNREQILFPKDLYTTHQNTNKQIKIKANKKYNNQIIERAKLLERFIFKCENFSIRPAKSALDLIEEGAALNHCVATHYTVPYAEGKTNIFFVRKISEPNKPYCTVEVKDNEVRQAYIKDDKIPNKETLEFIEVFKKAKLNVKTKNIKVPAQVYMQA